MGTTVDKLNAIKNSKEAIRTKFNLAADLPFSQYADNITVGTGGVDLSFITATAEDILEGKVGADIEGNPVEGLLIKGTDVSATTATASDVSAGKQFYDAKGNLTEGTLVPSSGGGGEYYLCSYVNRNYFSYDKIVVSGMPTDAFVGATYTNQETWESADVPTDIAARDPNGTYTLTNPDAQYTSQYVWQSENGCVIAFNDMNYCFAIEPGAEYKGTGKISMSGGDGSASYPVPEDYNTSYNWVNSSWNTIEGGSVVVPEPAAVEQYWEGYKLIQNEDGKYDYAAEVTRLTYGDYMPVTGRIYDGGCTMEITNVDLTEDALWACPHDMTANENADWVITASGQEYNGDDYAPVNVFDGNKSSRWWSNYTSADNPSFWIQWKNINRKVLINYLRIWMGDQQQFGNEAYLIGSNDGTTWTDIARGNIAFEGTFGKGETIDGYFVYTFDFKGNPPCYQYYRLGRNHTGSYSIQLYHIEAYTQIPREVPK